MQVFNVKHAKQKSKKFYKTSMVYIFSLLLYFFYFPLFLIPLLFFWLGIYKITMDSEDGSVRICGRVNPRTFLKVIEKSGKHAEVKSIRFDGEAGDRRYYPYGDDPTNQLSYPHSYQSFPEQSHWFDRTYPNLPRPQPYPWQLMLPQPQPQPVPWPVIWPGWPPHQDNPFEANQDNNNQRCCTVMWEFSIRLYVETMNDRSIYECNSFSLLLLLDCTFFFVKQNYLKQERK